MLNSAKSTPVRYVATPLKVRLPKNVLYAVRSISSRSFHNTY